jgi:thiosulfate/3-mercaptopyruvate sulfurtransferase
MNQTNSPIISTSELLKIYNNENVIVINACGGEQAIKTYNKKHLKGALAVDLDTDLADIKKDVSIGGRHPLPTISQFSKTLTNLGISNNHHIVIYDDKNGSNSSARFWWMLKAAGIINVQVLNGGFQEAERKGFPMSSTIEKPKTTATYKFSEWKLPIATIDELSLSSKNEKQNIIDVRSFERFNGTTEPIDLIAGHIPNAINIPLTENLDSDGLFKSPQLLNEKYKPYFENSKNELIVHCGSGVTACHTLLAMDYAGFKIPKLYVGSWSEWSRNNKPISTDKHLK